MPGVHTLYFFPSQDISDEVFVNDFESTDTVAIVNNIHYIRKGIKTLYDIHTDTVGLELISRFLKLSRNLDVVKCKQPKKTDGGMAYPRLQLTILNSRKNSFCFIGQYFLSRYKADQLRQERNPE